MGIVGWLRVCVCVWWWCQSLKFKEIDASKIIRSVVSVYLCTLVMLTAICVCACVCVCVCIWRSLCYTPLTGCLGPSPPPCHLPSLYSFPCSPPVFVSALPFHWCNLISSSRWTFLERPLTVTMVTDRDTCHRNLVKLFVHFRTHTHPNSHIQTQSRTCTHLLKLRYKGNTQDHKNAFKGADVCINTLPPFLQEHELPIQDIRLLNKVTHLRACFRNNVLHLSLSLSHTHTPHIPSPNAIINLADSHENETSASNVEIRHSQTWLMGFGRTQCVQNINTAMGSGGYLNQ